MKQVIINSGKMLKKRMLKIFLSFAFITLAVFFSMKIFASDYEYEVNFSRDIWIDLDYGTINDMFYMINVDRDGNGYYSGQWINGLGIGYIFKDRDNNDHTIECYEDHQGDIDVDWFNNRYWYDINDNKMHQHTDCVGVTPWVYIETPAREGYTFDGWETDTTVEYYGGYYRFRASCYANGGGDLHIKAKWKAYMETGWDEGFSGVSGTNQWYAAGDTATLAAKLKPGYMFDYAEDLDNGARYYANPDTWLMNGSRRVYLHSVPIDIFVNYYANGGSENNYYSKYSAASTANKYDKNIFSKTGYTFAGYSQDSGGAIQHQPGDLVYTISGNTTIRNASNSNMCVDIAEYGRDNGSNIWTSDYNGSWNQQWAFVYWGEENGVPYWRIQNPETCKVLDVDGMIGKNGANVHLYQWNGTDNQLWTIEMPESGTDQFVYIRSKTGQYYLDINGYDACEQADIQIWEKDNGRDQLWRAWEATVNCYANWKQEAAKVTKYTVRHWQQNVDGSINKFDSENYTLKDTDVFTGTVDTKVKPNVRKYEGFTSPQVQELVVLGDGLSEVDYYYSRNNYTIHFDANGGGNGPEDVVVKYGEVYQLEKTPERTGYLFKSWSTVSNGAGVSFAPLSKLKNLTTVNGAVVTLYAIWTDREFETIKIANSWHGGTFVRRTAKDEQWYNTVGRWKINEPIPMEHVEEIWYISPDGTIIRG
ncbi:MAG: RICIN domain-containing protein [Eubacteriales bacterium]|nr:RICIN domain-containing protein [Eubacteriales bacterium]